MWIVVAAVCAYAIGHRFYGAWVAASVLTLDTRRATPAVRLNNGRDCVPSNRWVVFGHLLQPLQGPVRSSGPHSRLSSDTCRYPVDSRRGRPRWLCAGHDSAVHVDAARLTRPCRMARDELGPIGGYAAMLGTVVIMVILIAVLRLVVVNAMRRSPWGTSPRYSPPFRSRLLSAYTCATYVPGECWKLQ